MSEKEVISWFLFKPHGWGERFLDDRCAARVHDTYGVGFHQCSRKPKQAIGGHGWCGQHVSKIQERLSKRGSECHS